MVGPTQVGVGIPVARDPLHRSQRAELPHWAPASGRDEPQPLRRSVRPNAATSRIRSSACRRPNPAQCPEPGLPARIALGLGPFPPSTPQVLPALRELLCSPTSSVLWVCPTSRARASMSCSFRIHIAGQSRFGLAEHGTSRVPCKVFPCMCGVYDRAGLESADTIAANPMWPSAFRESVGVPEYPFRGSIPDPHVPLSTLRH